MSKDQPPELAAVPPIREHEPGPLKGEPPTFEESAEHLLVDSEQGGILIPPGGEEHPPEFAPYDAEYWVTNDERETIVSHDTHLNEDGEALYRFLLFQSNSPPTYFVRCRGTHRELADSPGVLGNRVRAGGETVVDFDFAIDLTSHVPHRATQWTAGDDEPVYRGRMVREVGVPGSARRADHNEVKRFKHWLVERDRQGLPPWIGGAVAGHGGHLQLKEQHHDVLKSSWTLRQWADDYCASRNIFKEFVYEKVVYGWSVGLLSNAISSAIRSAGYTGLLEIKFETNRARVVIRPHTRLSRALSNPLAKIVFVLTLLYPFIWLFRKFTDHGGGRWTVGGGAYAMKRWECVESDGEHAAPGSAAVSEETVQGHIVQTPLGPKRVVGLQEGDWFRVWEDPIRLMVLRHTMELRPMTSPI